MKGLKVILGVSGSVAAYRAADLARELGRQGAEVRICLTDGAKHFVTPLLFESLTAQPILDSVFEEPEKGRMAHIDWARWADLILVAPATANVISKFAHGLADDMLSAIWLASTSAKMVAPAMNPAMFAAESTQSSLNLLENRGAWIVSPDEGDVACGEHGEGKLATIDRIVGDVCEWAQRRDRLKGKTVLITSGPTEEPIDLVRVITNRSSGKMGLALARAAMEMGAKVIVVSGPVAQYPPADELIPVRTALEMESAALAHVAEADFVFGVAAVADYRLEHPFDGKMRRSGASLDLHLIPNPDILANLAQKANKGANVIGFAAEPSPDLETARGKLKRKGLTAIAVNDISDPRLGFGSEKNQLTLIRKDEGVVQSPVLAKLALARWLFDQIAPARP